MSQSAQQGDDNSGGAFPTSMMSQRFRILTTISAVLLSATVGLFISAFRGNSYKPLISATPSFHVTATGGFHWADARLAFFSAPIGPYRGSLIALGDASDIHKSHVTICGVYYRHFRWANGEVLWTLMMSLWYPIVLFSMLPAVAVWSYCRARGAEAREPSDTSSTAIFQMPEEYRTPEYVDRWGDPQPPWSVFRSIPRFSVGWRRPPAVRYWKGWHSWYASLTAKHRSQYRWRHRPPMIGWGDFYVWTSDRNFLRRCCLWPLAVVWIWYTLPFRCLFYPVTVWRRVQL